MDARPKLRGLWPRVARFVLPFVIVLAALGAHRYVVAAGERHERDAVRAAAERHADALSRRIDGYVDALYAIRGLFASSRHVTLSEFRAFNDARKHAGTFPGLRAVGYADLLARDDVDARVAQVNAERTAAGLHYPPLRLRLPEEVERTAPVTYIEPQLHNEAAVGLDLLAEPVRHATLERALQTDQPEATAPLRLVVETQDQHGFLVMLAVRDATGKPRGITYAAFRIGDLVDSVAPPADRRGEIELYDLGPVGAASRDVRRLTYDGGGAPDEHDHATHPLHTVDFEILGRRWALHFTPTTSFASPNQRLLDLAPLGAGALLALLAAWLLGASHRTERRAVALAQRMTESLRTSQTDLARSNAELERFAYVASHDLREPLRTITGFLGLLSRRYRDRLDDDGREFVDLAVAGAKRMDALIAELLEYSRVGRNAMAAEPTDLQAAWQVAVRNLSAAIAEADADVSADRLPVVLANRGEMVQVLQNLVGNAIKYRGEQPPRIRVEAVRRGDHWEISVADNGPGIHPRHHERVFVLLQRLHRHDDVVGTGIGLAICKKIIESHGGRIWVESAEGTGARFTFSLPAADAPARAARRPLRLAA